MNRLFLITTIFAIIAFLFFVFCRIKDEKNIKIKTHNLFQAEKAKKIENNYKIAYVSILAGRNYFDSIIILEGDQHLVLSLRERVSPTELELFIFKVEDYNLLLRYITIDKNTKKIGQYLDRKKIRLVKREKVNSQDFIKRKKAIKLNNGIWYFEIKNKKDLKTSFFVVKSDFFILAKNGGDKILFWGINTKAKKVIKEGKLLIFNLYGNVNQVGQFYFNSQGVIEAPINKKFDLALYKNKNQISLIFLNFTHLNNYPLSYEWPRIFKYPFGERESEVKKIILLDKTRYFEGEPINYRVVFITSNIKERFSDKKFFLEVYQKDKPNIPFITYEFKLQDKDVHDGVLKNLPVGNYYIEVKDKRYYDTKEKECEEFNAFYFSVIKRVEEKNSQNNKIINEKINEKIKINVNKEKFVLGEKIKLEIKNESKINKRLKFELIFDGSLVYNRYFENLYIRANEEKEIWIETRKVIDKPIIEENLNASIIVSDIDLNDKKIYLKDIKIYRGEFDLKLNLPRDFVINSDEPNCPVVYAGIPIKIPIKVNYYLGKGNIKDNSFFVSIRNNNFEKTKNIKLSRNKELSFIFNEKRTGRYLIKIFAFDSKDNLIEKSYSIEVVDINLQIENKKRIYDRNDFIELRINSLNTSNILLTLEEKKILKYIVLSLRRKSDKLIKIPLYEIPSLESSKLKIRVYQYDNKRKDVKVYEKEIVVLIKEKLIDIKLFFKKENKIGKDKIIAEVRTTDFKNRPISSNLIVWIDGKNIFGGYSLDKEEKNFKNFFYSNHDSDDEEILKLTHSVKDFTQVMGISAAYTCPLRIYYQIDFSEEILYWNHLLKTDERGRLEIELDLLHKINKVNITIFAYTFFGNKIGQRTFAIKN